MPIRILSLVTIRLRESHFASLDSSLDEKPLYAVLARRIAHRIAGAISEVIHTSVGDGSKTDVE